MALAAVQAADPMATVDATVEAASDASHTHLRALLAKHHGVDSGRVLLAASGSEFVFRFTAWVAQRYWADEDRQGQPQVGVPRNACGVYAQAAQAWGLQPVVAHAGTCQVWCCEPGSPLGTPQGDWPAWIVDTPQFTEPPDSMDPVDVQIVRSIPVVLDCTHAPLRLGGEAGLNAQQLSRVWRLWSPNKALGLAGVHGAYAIAPLGMQGAVAELARLAPSSVLGAHAVALLQAWAQPDTQAWLVQSLLTLRSWKARQIELLQGLGWTCLPSEANYFCASPPEPLDLQALRGQGIQLRDASEYGLPGYVRLGVLAPQAQDALAAALA